MLSVEGIDVFYGNIQALRKVTLRVDDGEMVALVGANGSGKTTTLRTISGLLRPQAGSISFEGRPIEEVEPQHIVEQGVAHVPEGRGIFPGLSVEENLRMGNFVQRRNGNFKEGLDLVLEYFPRLAERTQQLAGTLSGGEQQMLALARAMLSRPKLLLIDEPSLGLAPILVQQLFENLASINREQKTAMLLVEQFVNLALRHTTRAYVLAKGEVKLAGESAALLEDTDLVGASYMGGEVSPPSPAAKPRAGKTTRRRATKKGKSR